MTIHGYITRSCASSLPVSHLIIPWLPLWPSGVRNSTQVTRTVSVTTCPQLQLCLSSFLLPYHAFVTLSVIPISPFPFRMSRTADGSGGRRRSEEWELERGGRERYETCAPALRGPSSARALETLVAAGRAFIDTVHVSSQDTYARASARFYLRTFTARAYGCWQSRRPIPGIGPRFPPPSPPHTHTYTHILSRPRGSVAFVLFSSSPMS